MEGRRPPAAGTSEAAIRDLTAYKANPIDGGELGAIGRCVLPIWAKLACADGFLFRSRSSAA